MIQYKDTNVFIKTLDRMEIMYDSDEESSKNANKYDEEYTPERITWTLTNGSETEIILSLNQILYYIKCCKDDENNLRRFLFETSLFHNLISLQSDSYRQYIIKILKKLINYEQCSIYALREGLFGYLFSNNFIESYNEDTNLLLCSLARISVLNRGLIFSTGFFARMAMYLHENPTETHLMRLCILIITEYVKLGPIKKIIPDSETLYDDSDKDEFENFFLKQGIFDINHFDDYMSNGLQFIDPDFSDPLKIVCDAINSGDFKVLADSFHLLFILIADKYLKWTHFISQSSFYQRLSYYVSITDDDVSGQFVPLLTLLIEYGLEFDEIESMDIIEFYFSLIYTESEHIHNASCALDRILFHNVDINKEKINRRIHDVLLPTMISIINYGPFNNRLPSIELLFSIALNNDESVFNQEVVSVIVEFLETEDVEAVESILENMKCLISQAQNQNLKNYFIESRVEEVLYCLIDSENHEISMKAEDFYDWFFDIEQVTLQINE